MSEKLKIGELIREPQERDAIHVAVVPAKTGEDWMRAGAKVVYINGEVFKSEDNSVGVIDPFLKEKNIPKGTVLWLFLHPGSITSLRHDWTHPAIDRPADRDPSVKESELWVRKFLKGRSIYVSEDFEMAQVCYEEFIETVQAGEPYIFNTDYHGEEDGLLHYHLGKILGRPLGKDVYFGCSC